MEKLKPWIKTTAIAALGGGIAAIVATLADPSKYRFPQDLGSGKMWPFFLQGIAVTVGALLLKSPFGQKVRSSLKDSQEQLAHNKQIVEDIRTQVKTQPPTSGAKP